jgi:glutamate carboxypeptidase
MQNHQPILDWIAAQDSILRARLIEWSNINTGTGNTAGIEKLIQRIKLHAANLDGKMEEHTLPPAMKIDARGLLTEFPVGRGLSITKRPESPRRVFLGIHLDTVYPPDDPFQTATIQPDGTIRGPGVADAKGGLLVLLTALAAFERSPLAGTIGWEVLLNPDEEIGSSSSAALLLAAAKRSRMGLVFEPALRDGGFADRRKGAGNFAIVIHGRSAHTGRDFAAGRSAILAASEITIALHELNRTLPGVIVNVGKIEGGSPANVVPDLAVVRVNCRTENPGDESRIKAAMDRIIAGANRQEGIHADIHGQFHTAPKIPDERGQALLAAVISCGAELGLALSTHSVGGSCDGNKLAAAGLPNVDTLGVCGGNMHSPDEFACPESLVERAQLTALLLLRFAGGDIAALNP